MKIYVSNIPDTHNYGSAMMVINALYYLRKELPEAVFYTDCKNYDHLSNIMNSTGIDRIYKSPIVKDYWRIREFISGIIRCFDAVLILGGDDFAEYYTRFYLLFELDIIRELSAHMKVLMLGQTLGPFTPFVKSVAERSLKDALIFTRDPKCFQYCRIEMGLQNIVESQDLSLLDLPDQSVYDRDLLHQHGLVASEYVTLVPSGFAEWYCENRDAYIDTWVSIIKDMLCMPYLRNKLIFLLPHDIRQPHSDLNCILEIISKLDDESKQLVRYTDRELSPSQARSILGNGCYTVTGRMHAGLSTLQIGKPAIFLSYSVKYQGVVGEGMNLPELIIEAVGNDLWEEGTILNQTMEKVRLIQENYDTFLNRIRNEINKAKDLSLRQVSRAADYLKQ